jgi:hypothetical protein
LLLLLLCRPSSYTVPLFPFVPALSVGLNTCPLLLLLLVVVVSGAAH